MYVSDSTKYWNIDKYQNIVILQCRNIWNILQWWEGIAKLSGIWNVTELQYIFLELSFNEKWRDLEIYDVGKTSIFKSCLKQPYGAGNLHFCRISSHEQHPTPAKSHCTLVPKRIYKLWRILFVVFPTKPWSYVDNPKNGTPTKKRQHTFTSSNSERTHKKSAYICSNLPALKHYLLFCQASFCYSTMLFLKSIKYGTVHAGGCWKAR